MNLFLKNYCYLRMEFGCPNEVLDSRSILMVSDVLSDLSYRPFIVIEGEGVRYAGRKSKVVQR